MNPIKTSLLLAVFTIGLLSCSDEDFADDKTLNDLQFETCWSEPDNNAQPVQQIYQNTTPMKFNIGTKYSFKYRILTPTEYNSTTTQYPLIIYLHGLDARGLDNSKQMNYAAFYFIEHNNQYPAIVVYPQCPNDAYWGLANRPSNFHPDKMDVLPNKSYMDIGLIKLIEDLQNSYRIDAKRIYIAGHSMGGIGTLDMIANHPNIFAAAISFCGTINPLRFTTSHEVPLMLYHNADDDIITVGGSRKTYQRLLQLGSEVIYNEGSSGGHICWNEAVNTPDMINWLYSHSLDNRNEEQ